MSFDYSRRSKPKPAQRRQTYGRKTSPQSLRAVAPAKKFGQREVFERRHIGTRRTPSQSLELLPLVTVILAIRNEEKFIDRSLGAILAQDYPADRMEVVVADGMSTDATREKLTTMQSMHPNLRIVDNPGKYVSAGLNAAIRVCRGEFVVRVDGHTIVASDFVRRSVEKLQTTDAMKVGGAMHAVSEGKFGKCVALATSSPFGVGGARQHYCREEVYTDAVYLGAWRRETFARYGLFDETQVINEDDEMDYRLQENGGRMLLCPAIKSVYYNRSTPRALARQYFRYGYWKIRVLQMHPRQMRLRQFAPPAFVGSLLVTLALALFTSFGIYLFAGLLGLYLTANVAAATFTARKSSWRHFPGLVLSFGLLHFGYGAGFLLGLVKFAHRWGDKGEVDYLSLDQAETSRTERRASRIASRAELVEATPLMAAVS